MLDGSEATLAASSWRTPPSPRATSTPAHTVDARRIEAKKLIDAGMSQRKAANALGVSQFVLGLGSLKDERPFVILRQEGDIPGQD
jgi:hypothetical protein